MNTPGRDAIGGSGEPCRMLSDIINKEREGHLHAMQNNTKNRAAMASPRIRTMRGLMPASNAGAMDGGGEKLGIGNAEHRTRMARGNSREEGTEAGRHIMLASMRAKGTSAFDADTMNKVTMNKRHMDMPSMDAIIGRHEMPG